MSKDSDDFVMVSENKVVLSYTKEKEVATTEAYSAYVALNLVGPAIEDSESGKRSKLAITAVLDRSGSMAGRKINLTRTAMHFITEQLQPDDYFGIVTYDHNVTTEFQLTKADTQNQELFDKKIDSILTGGSTNLSGGLLSGIEQQTLARQQDLLSDTTIRAVLLCTDGLANQGIVDSKKLANITQKQVSNEQNLRVHAFGFGVDHDPKMLKEIAEAGQGDFYYVENDEAIPQAFGNVLGGLLSVGAQNVRIVITPIDPSFRVVKIWDKVIDQKQLEDGSATITVRDLMSEIERKILFEYTVGKTDQEGVHELAKIDVHYFNVATESNENLSCTLSIDRQHMVPQDTPTSAEVSSNIARVKTTTTIENATATAEEGDLHKAKTIIQQALQELKNLNLSDKAYEKQLCNDLQKLALGFQDKRSYGERGGRHFANAISHSRVQQAQMFCAMPAAQNMPAAVNRIQSAPYYSMHSRKRCARRSLGEDFAEQPSGGALFGGELFAQQENSYSTKQQIQLQQKAADYVKKQQSTD